MPAGLRSRRADHIAQTPVRLQRQRYHAMAHAQLPVVRRRFGETLRRDRWWVQPAIVLTILSSFIVYATWAAFQGRHYVHGPYLSPFYSPELFGGSPHAWFGPRPGWGPAWLG